MGEWFSYSKSVSAGRTNYTGGLFPKKRSPVIPSHQSKQTLTFPAGSSTEQCQMSFPGALPLNFHFMTQLVPARVSVSRAGHRGGTRLPVSHTPPSAAWDTTRDMQAAPGPGSQSTTEIYRLCPELQFPRWGSGAPLLTAEGEMSPSWHT